MDGQLLVRVYNVGLGDCIYLRVPDKNRDVHILIDCGNKFGGTDLLGECINHLKEDLDETESNKKRLDLLVVSHPHEDHHKGFEAEFFEDIRIGNLWLSPAYDRQNPKAKGFFALQNAARRGLTNLSAVAFGDLKEEVEELLSLSKDEAIDMLCNILPEANGIQPRYVSTGTPPEQLQIFEDPDIKLSILGPMEDIDSYYFGGEGLQVTNSLNASAELSNGYDSILGNPGSVEVKLPRNISTQDFKNLRSRVHMNALALAEIAGHAVNNLSVILLLEWHGRRLLFPGDAEWHETRNGEVKKGRANGSWNVMWQERHEDLSRPLDFLKIGHHGSENATPWTSKKLKSGKDHPINQILDALLPLPQPGQPVSARAVASTKRTSRWPSIPNAELMAEIGRRIANVRPEYVEPPSRKSVPANTPQPQRTDLEAQLTDTPEKQVPYIEFHFS